MPTRTGIFATLVAAVLWTMPAAGAPPQSPPAQSPSAKYAVMHPSRPTPHKSAVDNGMSLEHECLNALRATRAATPSRPAASSDNGRRDTAALHLDRAESAARAGQGQLCQDELALATDSLR
jgi:hypothetical protein